MTKAAAVYIIHHDNYALNTNQNFSKIDGQPRASIYQKNVNDPDQHYESIWTGSSFMYRQPKLNKCLNAHYLYAGGPVNFWPCNSSDPDQQWTLLSAQHDMYALQRKGTDLCLDNYDRQNEGGIHLWHCDRDNNNQRWYFDPLPNQGGGFVPPSNITSTGSVTGQVFNSRHYALNQNFLYPNAPGAGLSLQGHPSDSADLDQQFRIYTLSNGAKAFQNLKTNNCLDSTSNLRDGQLVTTWACDFNNVNQQWDVIGQGSGLVKIRRKGSNMCVDMYRDANLTWEKVHLWVCHDSPNQLFKLGKDDLIDVPRIDANTYFVPEDRYTYWQLFYNFSPEAHQQRTEIVQKQLQFGFDIILGGEVHCITGMYYDVNAVEFVETNDNRALSCAMAIPIGTVFKIAKLNKTYKATVQTTEVINGKFKTITQIEPVISIHRANIRMAESSLQHTFARHAHQWGFNGINYNKNNGERFLRVLFEHIHGSKKVYKAKHRGAPALVYVKQTDPSKEALAVITTPDNRILAAYKLTVKQHLDAINGASLP